MKVVFLLVGMPLWLILCTLWSLSYLFLLPYYGKENYKDGLLHIDSIFGKYYERL